MIHCGFSAKWRSLGLITCAVLLCGACATSKGTAQSAASPATAPPAIGSLSQAVPQAIPQTQPGAVAVCWLPLVERLKADKVSDPAIYQYFHGLPEYSSRPMSVKIRELYAAQLRRRSPDDGVVRGPSMAIQRGVVTAATVAHCSAFMNENKSTLDAMERKYPVPREIITALLMVETRLGGYMGSANPFWSLASMAAADSPAKVRDGISGLPLTREHDDWLQSRLTDKSDWAYKEMKALLSYCSSQRLDPHNMVGSVYGAIGYCQFMPSNLLPYGDDGDGDGVVNLFSMPDAIFSAARYLTGYGWRAGIGPAEQREVLKKYNNLNIYANTIMALAESIRSGTVQAGPPDGPRYASSAGKSSTGKKAAKTPASGRKRR